MLPVAVLLVRPAIVQEILTLALHIYTQCHLWLSFWCDLLGALLVLGTCLLSVGLKEQLGGAAVGLAISNTIQVPLPLFSCLASTSC